MKRPHLIVRFLLAIVSLVLCLALFVTGVVTMVLADVRILISEENLQTVVTHVFFGGGFSKPAPMIQRQGVGAPALKLEKTGELTDTQKQMVEWIYGMLEEELGEEIPMTLEDVEALLAKSTLPDFVSGKMAAIMSDILTGEYDTTLTSAEVLEQIDLNAQLIKDTFGVEITQEMKDEIAKAVDEMDVIGMVRQVVEGELNLGGGAAPENPGNPEGDFSSGTTSKPNKPGNSTSSGSGSAGSTNAGGVINGLLNGTSTIQDIIDGGIPTILSVVREITSLNMLLTLLAVCLIIIGLLFVTNLWQPHVAIRGVGLTAMFVALPLLIPTAIVMGAPDLVNVPGMDIAVLLLDLTKWVCIGVFAGGFVLLVLSIVLGTIQRKKWRAMKLAAMAAPVVEPVVAEVPVMEEVPVVEEIPVAEETPVMEELPVEETPAVEEVPAAEEAPEEV